MNEADQHFVAGWLSAYNAYQNQTYDITAGKDLDSIMAWVDKYCRENPLEGLQSGLLHLTSELYDKRTIKNPAKH